MCLGRKHKLAATPGLINGAPDSQYAPTSGFRVPRSHCVLTAIRKDEVHMELRLYEILNLFVDLLQRSQDDYFHVFSHLFVLYSPNFYCYILLLLLDTFKQQDTIISNDNEFPWKNSRTNLLIGTVLIGN